MQTFEILAAFFLVEKYGPWKKERKKNNANNSGHLRLCQHPRAAHALLSDQKFRNHIAVMASGVSGLVNKCT
jgi:hypothetical protein